MKEITNNKEMTASEMGKRSVEVRFGKMTKEERREYMVMIAKKPRKKAKKSKKLA